MKVLEINDGATPRLQALLARLANPRPLHEAMGARMVNFLRTHFRSRQREGNRRGWPHRYFWYGTKGVAQLTAMQKADETGAEIAIASPAFAHKVKGGTIEPKRGRALAIPLSAEAYKKSDQGRIPDVFKDAFVIRTQKGAFIVRQLFERVTGKKFARSRLQFLFKLVPRVTQAADPHALPPREAVLEMLRRTIDSWAKRNLKTT